MILKNLFIDIWKYNKPLFVFVFLFILVQLFYSFQFARLAHLVDHQKTVPHPIAFEAFPFVVYNMYSGKIDDWNKYSYLKIEADGEEIKLTDLAVIQEDQFVNPSQKFIGLKTSNFYDEGLTSFLNYTFNSSAKASSVYAKVSNQQFLDNETAWNIWLKKYLSVILKRDVRAVKIFDCAYTYNAVGKPEFVEQKLLYQFE